jgi:shikimate kinase
MNTAKPAELQEGAKPLRERLGRRAIVLVGMPGSGKSSIGRRLAPKLDMDFVDADTEIVKAANGMTIPEIFAKHGEPEFRSLEARVIGRLLEEKPSVIATGGGAFMNADTRSAARKNGISIWLKAEIPVLLRRVKRKNDRPLLRGDDPEGVLKKLLSEREHSYAEADIVITSRESPHETVVDEIIDNLERWLTERAVEGRS